jgi:cytochrome c oxidase subunit 2
MSLLPFRSSNAKRSRAKIVGIGLSVVVIGLAVLATAQSLTSGERVIKISAERYEYSPAEVTLKKGEPVILELSSEDRLHGFHVAELGVRADVVPGQPVRVRVVPDKIGTFRFSCDLFCGSGHGDMSGMISVTD